MCTGSETLSRMTSEACPLPLSESNISSTKQKHRVHFLQRIQEPSRANTCVVRQWGRGSETAPSIGRHFFAFMNECVSDCRIFGSGCKFSTHDMAQFHFPADPFAGNFNARSSADWHLLPSLSTRRETKGANKLRNSLFFSHLRVYTKAGEGDPGSGKTGGRVCFAASDSGATTNFSQ